MSNGSKRDGEREVTLAEFVTAGSLLGISNREVYREIRRVMWLFIVENSARSDFPSKMS